MNASSLGGGRASITATRSRGAAAASAAADARPVRPAPMISTSTACSTAPCWEPGAEGADIRAEAARSCAHASAGVRFQFGAGRGRVRSARREEGFVNGTAFGCVPERQGPGDKVHLRGGPSSGRRRGAKLRPQSQPAPPREAVPGSHGCRFTV